MAEPRDTVSRVAPEVDEQTKLAGMRAATATAATMPKVDPATGELPDLFAGKFGFIDALANDPTYGEEIKKIRDALIAQNKTLAETLYRKSKWAQLDTDAQDAYLLKLQNNKLYKEKLNSWLINIKKTLVQKSIDVSDETLEKYYLDGVPDATIIDELTPKITAAEATGSAAESLKLLRDVAQSNGFDLDTEFAGQVDSWLQQIARGKDIDDFARIIRNKAAQGKSKYIQDKIKLGQNLKDIYAPFLSKIADTFDIDTDLINLDDPIFSKIFTDKGPVDNKTLLKIIQSDPRFAGSITGNKRAANIALTKIDLENAARDNNVDLNALYPEGIDSIAGDISDGIVEVNSVLQTIRNKAAEGKSKFVQEQLKAGKDLRAIYASYINDMATAFNVDAATISLDDELLKKAFTDKGAVKFNEFQNFIRQDARYKGTTGAASEASLRKQIADRAVFVGATVTDSDIDTILSELLATGISPSNNDVDAKLRKFIKFSGTKDTKSATGVVTEPSITGAAGNNFQVLKETAARNGIDLEKAFGGSIEGWLQKIDQGESIETYKRLIRDAAKMGLPDNVKKMLDQGVDLTTIFDPYRNYMGRILEINPDTIDINDTVLRSAIGPDKEMTLFDFQRALRKDPRWQYTNQAREDVSDAIRKITQDFGLAG